MATLLNGNNKDCATCEFWTGNRPFINNLHTAVKVEITEKGDCLERRTKTLAKQSCPKWMKWGALKK